MMYTYRRNLKVPLRPASKKSIYCNARDASFFLKAGMCISIVFLLVLSFVFAKKCGEEVYTASGGTINIEYLPGDASGSDTAFEDSLIDPKLILAQELPVIYGVDIEAVDDIDYGTGTALKTDIYFDVLPEEIKLEILRFSTEPKDFNVGAQGPQILIYHTHTEEAFRQTEGNEYADTGSCHTHDLTKSVVVVGEALKSALEGYGYTVLHDITNHQSKTSYERSLETMKSYTAQYPTLSVFIDVHRDSGKDTKDYVAIGGEECARIMFVVGTGQGYAGEGKDEVPNYESNYKLALAVTNELEAIEDGFTRPIRVKTGRYNQHVSDMCLLVEVGHNANTLGQALNSAKYVAQALSRVLDINGP